MKLDIYFNMITWCLDFVFYATKLSVLVTKFLYFSDFAEGFEI